MTFPINFVYGKLAGKVRNCDHVTMGCCNHYKHTPVAKHPDHEHMIAGVLAQPDL